MQLFIAKPDAPVSKVRALVRHVQYEKYGATVLRMSFWIRTGKYFDDVKDVGASVYGDLEQYYEDPIEVESLEEAAAIVKTETLIQEHMSAGING
ncbi:hypothetical protein [Vibrio phage PJN101]|nr:hypothetical protein [Vibrio phage PJN101]